MMKEQLNAKYVCVIFFLMVSSIAVFWQVKDHDYINLDDTQYIIENRHVQNGLTLDGVKWSFTSLHMSNWHPLTWISHMLDIHFFGLNLGAHHLMNLFFHIANTLLLFLILNRMTHALWRSAFVAALFALHPLHVESVAWLAERKDVLSTLFWMLTMGAYALYVEKPSITRYLFTLVFFALGLLAKPMLVTLPFVLLLLDYWPLDRFARQRQEKNDDLKTAKSKTSKSEKTPSKKPVSNDKSQNDRSEELEFSWGNILPLLREKIPLFILAFLSSIVTVYAQKKIAIKTLIDLPFADRIGNALVAYVSYMEKTIWPRDLAIFYPHTGMPSLWQVFIAFALLLGITIMILWKAKRFPYLSVGWFWFLGTLVPVIGLVQVGFQSMADRYTYISLIGLFICMAWGFTEFTGKWPRQKIILSVFSLLILTALLFISFKQVTYWKDNKSLFQHALQVTENNFLAHYNLGIELVKQGKTEDAIAHYQECLRICPNVNDAHYNLGVELAKQGKIDEAIAHYREALKIAPDFALAHINLGAELARQGKMEEAIAHYREALKIEPGHPLAHFNLGVELVKQGKIDEAIVHYRNILEKESDQSSGYSKSRLILAAHINWGIELAKQGKMDEASAHFNEVLRMDPENKIARLYFKIINKH